MSRGIRRIAIAGHFLDAMQTRLHTKEDAYSVSYVSAPVEQHQISDDGEGDTAALTALQLYHDDLLSADPTQSVALTIGNSVRSTRGRRAATAALSATRLAGSSSLSSADRTNSLPSTCTAVFLGKLAAVPR